MKVHRVDGSTYEKEGGPRPYNRQNTTWVYGKPVPHADAIRGDALVKAYTGVLNKGYTNPDDLLARVRKDGWMNAITGIGDPSRDKRHLWNSTLTLDILSQQDCELIWRTDDMAAKMVEKIPEEMMRQGWCIKIEDDKGHEIAEAVESWARDFDVDGKIKEGLEYSRAYGGAGLLLGADDGQADLTKPLNIDKVKSFQWTNVLTPLELFPRIWYGDPHAPKYGEPMIYRVQRFVFGGAVETGFSEKIFEMPLVHESRIIRIDGIRVSRRHLRQRNGWGDSVLMRTLQVISDFQQAYAGAAILVSDFAQAVLKIKDLADLVAANDQATIQARAQIIDMSRSIARAVVIDKEEEFERKGTPVSGLPELLERLEHRLASAADMPVSLLMGESPAGLNATGDSDIRWFYDRIKALQVRKLEPILRRILTLAFRSKGGPTKGKEPANWSIVFNPLWQLTDLEQAQRRFQIAQSDNLYVQMQAVSPEEVGASRFGGDEYNGDTLTLDLESRAAIQHMDPNDPRPGPIDGVVKPPPEVPEGEMGAKDPGDLAAPKGSGALGHKENPPNPGSTDGEPS